MTMIDNNKKLEALKAKLEESKFDEATILMISKKSNKFMNKLMLCIELVDNFNERLHDQLDEITLDEIKDGHEYKVIINPRGLGDTQVYTRKIWL